MAKKTEQEVKEIYDKINDWTTSETYPQMKYSPSTNYHYCPIHNLILIKPANAGNHNKVCKPSAEHTEAHTTELERLEQEQKRRDQKNSSGLDLVQTPEEMILMDNNKDIAEAAGMLAKDYELRAEFEILHLKKLIPWDWSFYDWIKIGMFQFWNNAFGLTLELRQDESVLTEEQILWLKSTIKENITHDREIEAAN